MGIKIKKTQKFETQRLKPLKIKYIFAVPLIGIVGSFTMFCFFAGTLSIGIWWIQAFDLIAALGGLVFAYWAFRWNLISEQKRIILKPVFGPEKTVSYMDIEKVEIHRKKKRQTMSYYSLHTKNGERIVKIYPMMANSGDFFNRLKQLGIRVEELADA